MLIKFDLEKCNKAVLRALLAELNEQSKRNKISFEVIEEKELKTVKTKELKDIKTK